MKPTGIISILLIIVLTILFNMSANVVEASYEDAETTEAELRFPFNKELEKVTNKNLIENEDVSSENSSSESDDVMESTVSEIEKSTAAVSSSVENDDITSRTAPVPVKSYTKKESNKTYTKPGRSSESDLRSSASVTKSSAPVVKSAPVMIEESESFEIAAAAVMIEEMEVTIMDDEVNLLETMEIATSDEASTEGEIIIEDVSIVETSYLDIVEDAFMVETSYLDIIEDNDNVDLPVAAYDEVMSAEDKTFFDLFEAAKNSSANVEERSSEFAAFIRPFQQLIVAETGDVDALIENIRIYDVYGKKVLEVSDVDLGGSAFNILPRGNYTIEVISGSAFHTAILSKL